MVLGWLTMISAGPACAMVSSLFRYATQLIPARQPASDNASLAFVSAECAARTARPSEADTQPVAS